MISRDIKQPLQVYINYFNFFVLCVHMHVCENGHAEAHV